ncbi:aspartyl protease-like protein [Aphelenchoides avenae]|nr:aspartyl protease-like protein [Aphelenchus avenae]
MDKQNCAKNWNFVNVNDDDSGFWKIFVDGFEFGSYKKTRKMGALLDTGNPGMELPDGLVRKISRAANAEYDWDTQLYLVDCNATFPDVVLNIGGVRYPMPASELILDIGYKPDKCVLNLQDGNDDVGGPFTLGDPFYRTFCTAFDVGQKRLGFSKSLI